MKIKLLIIALLIFAMSKAQITLDHTYPSVSQYMYLSVVEFVKHGYKYTYFDNATKTVRLYNLDHSLFKSIALQVPGGYGVNGILLSDSLFNADNLIEVVYSYSGGTPNFITYTKILDENGVQIFALPQSTFPSIVNTGAANGGYKMIIPVDSTNKNSVKQINVYSLVGGFPVHPINQTGLKESKMDGNVSSPVPNPSSGKTTIGYQLPPGQIIGTITVYDINGKELKNYQVDNTFNTLELDNTELPSGTYFYKLANSGEGKKMVVIK